MTSRTFDAAPCHSIEAWPLSGDESDLDAAREWCGGYVVSGLLVVPHPDGTLFASTGDVIVRYSDVRFAVMPGELFYDLYDDALMEAS